MPQLTITKGPDKGRVLKLKKDDTTTLGRGDATHRIDDEHISRRHARVFRHNDRWYVADLDSMNGTFVNGERIDEPVKLREGDEVRIGHTKIIVQKGISKKSKPAEDVDQEEDFVEQAVKSKKEKKAEKKKKAKKKTVPDDSESGAASSMLADILGDFDMGDDDDAMESFDAFDMFDDEDDEGDKDDDNDADDASAELDEKTKAIPDDEKTVLENEDED
jgi:pSer/pThr/pTyr-binding forkhead associated (FHA) protein